MGLIFFSQLATTVRRTSCFSCSFKRFIEFVALVLWLNKFCSRSILFIKILGQMRAWYQLLRILKCRSKLFGVNRLSKICSFIITSFLFVLEILRALKYEYSNSISKVLLMFYVTLLTLSAHVNNWNFEIASESIVNLFSSSHERACNYYAHVI